MFHSHCSPGSVHLPYILPQPTPQNELTRPQNFKSHPKSRAMHPFCSPSLAEESVRLPLPHELCEPRSPPTQEINEKTVYIFIGSILLDEHLLDKIFGSVVGIIGVAYVVLEFVPSIEPPQNMREADAGWGAEQV
jgi:hypothetical protein